MSQYLVIRADRLGDVLLSTPVFQAIHQQDAHASLTLLVQPMIVPIVQGLPEVQAVWKYQDSSILGLFQLWKKIRAAQFDVVIALQTHWKIGLVLFLAGIPKRVAPRSKLHSYLFYNQGVRQNRSQVKKHEAEYNLDLLKVLGPLGPQKNFGTKAAVLPEDQRAAKDWLQSQGWSQSASERWIAIHPGMGGSALNWPESSYLELIEKLSAEGFRILVTGGRAERDLLLRIQSRLTSSGVLFFCAGSEHSIGFLGGLYLCMRLVVAPSTGPLHLAVGLKKPVVTFYPPIRVQSSARWGPYSESSPVSVLSPAVSCPAVFHCLGDRCSFYPCMESLKSDQALIEIQTLLSKEGMSHG